MFFTESVIFASGGRSNYRIPSVVADKHGNVYAFCNDRKDTLMDHAPETTLVCRVKHKGNDWGGITALVGVPGWCCMIGSALYDDISDTVFCSVNKKPVARDEFRRYSEEEIRKLAEEAVRKEKEAGVEAGHHLLSTRDQGKSWTEKRLNVIPEEFTNIDGDSVLLGGDCHGSAHGIRLRRGAHAGRLICPSRTQAGEYCDWDGLRRYGYNNAVFSDDRGETWRASQPVQRSTGEGTLIENGDGSLTYNSRAFHGDQKRYLATSSDGGESWGEFRADEFLLEPKGSGCNASLLRVDINDLANTACLPDGAESLTLFADPRSETRENMTVCVSFDSGKSWPAAKRVYAGPCAYSSLDYSAVDGHFYLLYEKGGSDPYEYGVSMAEFDLEWLLS